MIEIFKKLGYINNLFKFLFGLEFKLNYFGSRLFSDF